MVLALTGIMGMVLNTQAIQPVIVLEIGLLGMFFWVSMLVDCATREPKEGNDKLARFVVIAFTSLIGAALYFFVRRPQRLAEMGR